MANPISRATLLFLFILPFILVLPATNKNEVPQWSVAAVFAAAMALCWLFRAGPAIRWTPLHTLVALSLVATLGLGVYHMGVPGVHNGMLQQTTLALFFMLGAAFLSDESGRKHLLQVAVICGSLVSLIGIAQYLSGSSLGLPAANSGASVFVNRNWAAAFMGIASPVSLLLLLAATGKRQTTLAALGAWLCLSYSAVTLSQGHWLALAAALLPLLILPRFNPELWRWFKMQRQRLILVATILLAAPLILAIPPSKTPIRGTASIGIDSSTYAGSVDTRLEFYRNTLEMIGDAPLTGSGPGTYYTRFQDYYNDPSPATATTERKGPANAHNDYLEYLAELGIPAGILVLGLLTLIWYSAWRMATDRTSTDQALTGSAFLLAVSTLYAHALVDFPLSMPVPAVYLWTMAGAMSGVWARQVPSKAKTPLRIRTPLILAGIIYLGVTCVYGFTRLRAEILINDAAVHATAKACPTALESSRQAFDLSPDNYVIWHHHLLIHQVCKSDLGTLYQEASVILNRAPSHPYAMLVSANALLLAGHNEDAAERYEELIQLIPHRASGYLGLGNALALAGDFAAAQVQFDKADSVMNGVGKRWRAGGYAVRELAALTQEIVSRSNQRLKIETDLSFSAGRQLVRISADTDVAMSDDGDGDRTSRTLTHATSRELP